MAVETTIIVHRKPFMAIDSQWRCMHKWLWDDFAGPNEGYTGYVDIWDTIPWQQVVLEDGTPHDFNYAAMAQYLPSYGGSGDYEHIFDPCVASGLNEAYCHNCLGLVGDIIALLEADGIADEIIKATYDILGGGVIKAVPLRDLFFRNFDPANFCCPVVFSRPMTYTKGAPGHIGDNNQQVFFVRAVDSCDGTEGLRVTLAPETYRNEFRADAMHFLRTVSAEEITAETAETAEKETTGTGSAPSANSAVKIPASARLVVYTLACGSVPRIQINGTWHVVSPEYFPPYGDPYGYCFRGHKHLVGAIHELPLHLGAGESNDFVVEHIAPLSDEIGAQVIFAIEYDEIINGGETMPAEKKPRKGRALGDYLVRWNQMVEALKNELAQNPHMQADYDALVALKPLAEAKDAEQEQLKGQLATVTAQLLELIKDAEKHYMALVRMLQAKFGPKAPEMKKYVTTSQAEVDKTKGDFKPKPAEQPK